MHKQISYMTLIGVHSTMHLSGGFKGGGELMGHGPTLLLVTCQHYLFICFNFDTSQGTQAPSVNKPKIATDVPFGTFLGRNGT